MISNIIYILFSAIIDFVIYSKMHNPDKIETKRLVAFVCGVLIISLFHSSLFKWPFLMSAGKFFGLLFFSLFPILGYLFFKYGALKSIARLKAKGVDNTFLDIGKSIFFFFFTQLSFFIAFLAQCAIILDKSS